MKTFRAFLILPLLLALAGCGSLLESSDPPEAQTYDESFYSDMDLDLDDPTGGYDDADEQPGFGEQAFYSMFPEDEPAEDPLENDPDVGALEDDPASAVYYARLNWGQLQFDPEIIDITDWSGRIELDRGALVVQRLIHFEPQTDWIEPRDSLSIVDLVSETSVHKDGLLLKIIDEDPGSGNLLRIDLGALSYVVETDSLGDYHDVVDVDELGNQFSIDVLPVLDCPNGFLHGVWVEGETDHGFFRGGWFSYEGELLGHYRGHWGVNDEGENVLRGKLVDPDGAFLAFLGGTWAAHGQRHGDGDFFGRYLAPVVEGGDELEPLGRFGGFYKKRLRQGGHLGGRWIEFCE